MSEVINFQNALDNADSPASVQLLDQIGSGTYGTIYRAIDPVTQQLYALKMFNIDAANGITSLIDISICCTIKCIGLCVAKDFTIKQDKVYVLLELARCDLYTYLYIKRLQIRDARRWMYETISAMNVLNHAGVIHGDLKPNNFLYYDNTDSIKICDFSLAIRTDWIKFYHSLVSSGNYRAPEAWVDANGREWDRRVDTWSLGLIFFELIYRKALFHYQAVNNEPYDIERARMFNVFYDWSQVSHQYWPHQKQNLNYYPSEFPDINNPSNLFWTFLKRMLILDYRQRASWADLLQDPYLTGITIEHRYQIRSTAQMAISESDRKMIDQILQNLVNNQVIRDFIFELYSRLDMMDELNMEQKISVCYFMAAKMVTTIPVSIRQYASSTLVELEKKVVLFLAGRTHFSYFLK